MYINEINETELECQKGRSECKRKSVHLLCGLVMIEDFYFLWWETLQSNDLIHCNPPAGCILYYLYKKKVVLEYSRFV